MYGNIGKLYIIHRKCSDLTGKHEIYAKTYVAINSEKQLQMYQRPQRQVVVNQKRDKNCIDFSIGNRLVIETWPD